jgi:chemotaxis response regulator CheB
MTTRVLIVDDHAGFRAHARAMLTAEGLDVVGEAVDGADAVGAVARLHPDVVLLDVCLPGGDGIEWCDAISTAGNAAPIILISSRAATDFGERLTNSIALGLLAKDDLCAEAVRRLLPEAVL